MARKKKRAKRRDPHLSCFSYPNCDEGGPGCVLRDGDDADPIGYRDEPAWVKDARCNGVMIVYVEEVKK